MKKLTALFLALALLGGTVATTAIFVSPAHADCPDRSC